MSSKPTISRSEIKCQELPKKPTKSVERGWSECFRPRLVVTVRDALARVALRESRSMNNAITNAIVDYLADQWYRENKPLIKERIIQGVKINV